MLLAVVPKDNPTDRQGASLVSAVYHFWQRFATRPLAPPAPPPIELPAPVQPPLTIPLLRPSIAQLALPGAQLPTFVAECPVARRYLELLGPLDWDRFPERPTNRPWPGPDPAPRAPYVAAYLIKLNEGLKSMASCASTSSSTPLWPGCSASLWCPTQTPNTASTLSVQCPWAASSAGCCATCPIWPPSSCSTAPHI